MSMTFSPKQMLKFFLKNIIMVDRITLEILRGDVASMKSQYLA